jgi:hypothetical protein
MPKFHSICIVNQYNLFIKQIFLCFFGIREMAIDSSMIPLTGHASRGSLLFSAHETRLRLGPESSQQSFQVQDLSRFCTNGTETDPDSSTCYSAVIAFRETFPHKNIALAKSSTEWSSVCLHVQRTGYSTRGRTEDAHYLFVRHRAWKWPRISRQDTCTCQRHVWRDSGSLRMPHGSTRRIRHEGRIETRDNSLVSSTRRVHRAYARGR